MTYIYDTAYLNVRRFHFILIVIKMYDGDVEVFILVISTWKYKAWAWLSQHFLWWNQSGSFRVSSFYVGT
jgi:hypothetical protein